MQSRQRARYGFCPCDKFPTLHPDINADSSHSNGEDCLEEEASELVSRYRRMMLCIGLGHYSGDSGNGGESLRLGGYITENYLGNRAHQKLIMIFYFSKC